LFDIWYVSLTVKKLLSNYIATKNNREIKIMETIQEHKRQLAINVEQASQLSTLSQPLLRKAIRDGELRVVRPGNSRRVVIMMKDFMNYLEGGKQ
jgi:excisionase family DNA binding protein